MSGQNRLFACPAPLQGSESYLTVLFCIPDTPDWRKTAAGLVSLLSYGRAFDEASGNIKETLEVGRGIFDTMTMCDLQTDLERIATATESIASNQPTLYTLAELEAVFVGNETINWEQVEAFLDVFGLLPSMKFEPAKYILEWIWRSQMLSNMYAQSTSQAAMAGALTKGLAIDGIEAVLETADDVTDFLTQILLGGGSLATGVAAIATLFKDTEEGSTIKVLQDIIVNLADVTVTVENSIECGTCGGGGCNNCRAGGAAFTPTGLEPTPCEPPAGFATWPLYTDYKCRASNRIWDDLDSAILELSTTHEWFRADLRPSGPYLSPIETLNRIGNFLPDLLPATIEATFTPSDSAATKEEINNRYIAFHRANVDDDWFSIGANVGLYYSVFSVFSVKWRDDEHEIKQAIFDAVSQPAVFQYLTEYIEDELDALFVIFPTWLLFEEAKTAILSFLSTGFTNLPFFNSSFAMNYSPTFACVGQMSCCVEVWQTSGSFDGELYSSEFNGTHHEIAMWFNVEGEDWLNVCGVNVMPKAANVVGFTALGSGDSVQLFTDAETTSWSQDAPIMDDEVGVYCGWFYRLRSVSAFSIDMDSLLDECV